MAGKEGMNHYPETIKEKIIQKQKSGESNSQSEIYGNFTPHIKPPAYEDFSETIIGVDSPVETVKIIEQAIHRQE